MIKVYFYFIMLIGLSTPAKAIEFKSEIAHFLQSQKTSIIVAASPEECITGISNFKDDYGDKFQDINNFWSYMTFQEELSDGVFEVNASSVFLDFSIKCTNGFAEIKKRVFSLQDIALDLSGERTLGLCAGLPNNRPENMSQELYEKIIIACSSVLKSCPKFIEIEEKAKGVFASLPAMKKILQKCKNLSEFSDMGSESDVSEEILDQASLLIKISEQFLQRRAELAKGFTKRRAIGLNAALVLAKYQNLSPEEIESLGNFLKKAGMKEAFVNEFNLALYLQDADSYPTDLLEKYSANTILNQISVASQIVKFDYGTALFDLLEQIKTQSEDSNFSDDRLASDGFLLAYGLTDDQKMAFAKQAWDNDYLLLAGVILSTMQDPQPFLSYHLANRKNYYLSPLVECSNKFFLPRIKNYHDLRKESPQLYFSEEQQKIFDVCRYTTFLEAEFIHILLNQIGSEKTMYEAMVAAQKSSKRDLSRSEKIIEFYSSIGEFYGRDLRKKAMKSFQLGANSGLNVTYGSTALEKIDLFIAINDTRDWLNGRKSKLELSDEISSNFDVDTWVATATLVQAQDYEAIKGLSDMALMFAVEQLASIEKYEIALEISPENTLLELFQRFVTELDHKLDNYILRDDFGSLAKQKFLLLEKK